MRESACTNRKPYEAPPHPMPDSVLEVEVPWWESWLTGQLGLDHIQRRSQLISPLLQSSVRFVKLEFVRHNAIWRVHFQS